MSRRIVVVVLGGVMAIVSAGFADQPDELTRAVQGKWVREKRTANGIVTILKEHKGKTTTLTAYDEAKNLLYAHTSDFEVERIGKVCLFTFSNRTITAGPNAGAVSRDPVSYLFRVDENRFYEVRGMLDGDKDEPTVVVWKREEKG